MMRSTTCALIAAVALQATACSNPQAISDANFRKALEPTVHDAFCRTIEVQRMARATDDDPQPFPIIVPAVMFDQFIYREKEDRAALEAAATAGLLSRTASTEMAKRLNYTEDARRQALLTYAPTPKGKPYFRAVERKTASGMLPFPAFCSADGEVVDVVRWTEPADAFGQKVTRVTYTVRGKDPIATASTAERAAMAAPRELTSTLVLASDGWRRID